jgi:addiction module HigA family antidote
MNGMRPIHPGEILKEELAEIGMTANAFAHELHVPANRITSIINGNRTITADTALRIARFFGTTPEFWLNLQSAYDLKIASQSVGCKIEQEVRSLFPTFPNFSHA